MKQANHAMEPSAWVAVHFGEVPLGDIRRTRRLQLIGEALAAEPGASIPQLFAHPYDVKAAYRFFDHPDVTPERVQSAHRAWVMEHLETAETYLLLEDTSDLDWTGTDSGFGAGGQLQRKHARDTAAFGDCGALGCPRDGPQRRPSAVCGAVGTGASAIPSTGSTTGWRKE